MSQRFPTVSPARLHEQMRSGPPIRLLDVRSPAEYRAGHVRGALSLPLDELDPDEVGELTGVDRRSGDQSLYLTCQSGLRAQEAAERLYAGGYRNLVLLQGGTEAWEKSALPMRRCGNAVSLERQVQITIGTLLILKVAFGFTVHELFFVLVALIGAGLVTAGATRWCGMSRLLARMPWNRGRHCPEQAAT